MDLNNKKLFNETLIYRTHLHPIIFLSPLLWLGLFLILYNAPFAENIMMLHELIIYIPILIAIADGIRTFIRYKTTKFIITDKCLISKAGLLRRNTSDFFINKIENIELHQSFLARSLGYGTLIVHGTGGTQASFLFMDNPIKFYRKVQEQVDQATAKPA